jgi:predicted TIM-barrel fold metal-dependent hydrolase
MSGELWDAHAHAFPDAERGFEWQSASPVALGGNRLSGDIFELSELMDRAGIGRTVILLFGRPRRLYEQLKREDGDRPDDVVRGEVAEYIAAYNRWGCDVGQADTRFLPFVNVDPNFMDDEAAVKHLVEMVAAGARGVKVVPSWMRLYPDDPRFDAVYQYCANMGLPIVAQSGIGEAPAAGEDPYSRPSRWSPVLKNFPDLKVVLAHLGHGFEDDVISMANEFDNLYADTSVRLSAAPLEPDGVWNPAALVELLRRIGMERVLFGTNYPMVSPVDYAEALGGLPLTDDERELISTVNFRRVIYGIEGGGTGGKSL